MENFIFVQFDQPPGALIYLSFIVLILICFSLIIRDVNCAIYE